MRTPLRRTIALSGLTAVVVVSGGIAAADGTSVSDIADLALSSAPEPTDLTVAEDVVTDDEAIIGDITAAADLETDPAPEPEPEPEPEPTAAPDRGDRTATPAGSLWHASWYGPGFHGNLTANGETYDQWAMTAAHKTLPFGTILRVTNPANGLSVEVRINDRGPFVAGRDIDLSRGAAEAIGMSGVAQVYVEQL